MKRDKMHQAALGLAVMLSAGAALAASNQQTPSVMPAPTAADSDSSSASRLFLMDTWWANHQSSEGFKEAIAQFGLTIEQMNENYEVMEARAKNPNDPLFWLKRTLETYPAQQDQYAIPVTEENGVMRDRTTQWNRNPYFLTREYGKAGERITIKTAKIPAGIACYAAMQGNMGGFDGPDGVKALASDSINTYVLPHDGILMLGCPDYNKDMSTIDTAVPMQILSGGSQRHPLFLFGINSQREWADFTQQVTPTGYGVFFDGRTRYAASQKKLRASANTNIMQTMRENLLRTITYDKLNGLDGSSALHQPVRSLFMASYDACCYASSGSGKLAIGFESKVPTTHGWGAWHEYGHQYQMGWSWGGQGEVTVNLYSLAACYTQLGHVETKQCHPNLELQGFTWDQQAVGSFLKSGQRWHFDTETNVFRRLTMFGQLLTTWPDLYPALGKAYREAYNRGENKAALDTTQEKIGWFVTNASRQSGRDLREFFTRWGLGYSAAAGEQIAAMKLPAPTQPTMTYEKPLVHSGNSPTTVSLQIDNDNQAHGIGLITNSAKIGPQKLVWVANGETTLHTQVVDAQNRPFTIALRGKKLTGGCAYHTINSAVTCGLGSNIHLSVIYRPEDNPDLPAGDYHGTLPLIAAGWHDPSWTANVNFPLTITK